MRYRYITLEVPITFDDLATCPPVQTLHLGTVVYDEVSEEREDVVTKN